MSYLLASQYLVFMFIGVVLHYRYLGRLRTAGAAVSVVALFAVFHVLWLQGPDHARVHNSASYALAVAIFTVSYRWRARFTGHRILAFLADISYPLYVIHGVAGYATLQVLLHAGAPVWAALPAVTVGAFVLAWVLHRLVEQPSQELGRRLARRASPRMGAA